MSALLEQLGRKVGPMPLGAWLLVGAGGLFIAWRSSQQQPAVVEPTGTEPLPTGGGYAGADTIDGAPIVLTPIFQVPDGWPGGSTLPAPVDPVPALPPAVPETPYIPPPPAAPSVPANTTIPFEQRTRYNTPELPPRPGYNRGWNEAGRYWFYYVPKSSSSTSSSSSKASSKPSTYTVKSGDTLSGIAARYGTSWTAIYNANRSLIDSTARAHGKATGGHWIFPGTTLRLP